MNVYIIIIKYRIQANIHRLVNEQTVIHQYNRIRKIMISCNNMKYLKSIRLNKSDKEATNLKVTIYMLLCKGETKSSEIILVVPGIGVRGINNTAKAWEILHACICVCVYITNIHYIYLHVYIYIYIIIKYFKKFLSMCMY